MKQQLKEKHRVQGLLGQYPELTPAALEVLARLQQVAAHPRVSSQMISAKRPVKSRTKDEQ